MSTEQSCLAGDSRHPGVSLRPPTTPIIAGASRTSSSTTIAMWSRPSLTLDLRSHEAPREPPVPARCSRCQGSPCTADAGHGHMSVLRSVESQRTRSRRPTLGVPVPRVSRRFLPAQWTGFYTLLISAQGPTDAPPGGDSDVRRPLRRCRDVPRGGPRRAPETSSVKAFMAVSGRVRCPGRPHGLRSPPQSFADKPSEKRYQFNFQAA